MLNHLHIQNYALIDDAGIDFSKGFSVITGETGAGKSIMLDALGLLLGKRAESNVLRNAEKKCIIEGEFDISNYGLESFFEQHGMEFEKLSIIRREIMKSGKSRAFVNDSPVVLSLLKKMGHFLIDVHSQNANVLLNSASFYYDLLDGMADSLQERERYTSDFKAHQKNQAKLDQIVNDHQQLSQELAFKQFQLNELKVAQIKQGEQQSLEQELLLLSNAEDIKAKINDSEGLLQDAEGSVMEKLVMVQQNMSSLSDISAGFEEVANRINSVVIELEDVQGEIEDLNRKTEADPEKLALADERLGTLFSLVKKFSVVDSDGLLGKQDELEKEVQLVVGGDDVVVALENQIKKERACLIKKAQVLTRKRVKAAKLLEANILSDLSSMNMNNARLEVAIREGELNTYGADVLDFLFNANKGGLMEPLSKVASGGEFSRIMLSLKRILSAKKKLPTILFDEIDTGVSGEVADKMALIMKMMSLDMQVISITHLPQIASKGNHHFKVLKTDLNEVTQSHIEQLNDEDRIKEIAQMLSGSNVTEAAVQNAKALLDQP